jgi:hypothetical protein
MVFITKQVHFNICFSSIKIIFAPCLKARMAKLVNVAVSEAVENCLLRVRVSLRAPSLDMRYGILDVRYFSLNSQN